MFESSLRNVMKQYQQCHLRNGNAEQVAWIEQRGARVGVRVELLPTKDLWEVIKVAGHVMPESDLREMQLMHRGSLPSVEPMPR